MPRALWKVKEMKRMLYFKIRYYYIHMQFQNPEAIG